MKRATLWLILSILLTGCGAATANDFYNATGAPAAGSALSSSTMRAEFASIEDGFDLLPDLTGSGSEFVTVNAGETALETVQPSSVPTLIGAEVTDNKDASGGYAGLTLYKVNMLNAAGTFTSFLTNTNTAARTYTFPDKDLTLIGTVDVAALKDGSNADALHVHTATALTDTTATGANLTTLTDGSNADALHTHAVQEFIIDTDTTLYLATTGNDTTGDGTSGTPWYSLEKVFDYLSDKWINTDVTVTVSIGAGTYTGLSSVTINHPCANNIVIQGASMTGTILTFSGEGVVVDGVSLKKISALTLKGASAASGTALSIKNGGHVRADDLKMDTWLYGLYGISASFEGDASSATIHTANCKFSAYFEKSTVDFKANTGTVVFDCNSISGSVGVSAYMSKVDVQKVEVDNADTGYLADENSFMHAQTSTAILCSTDYSPAVTTGNTPTFGNKGSWIYKP